MWQEVDAGLHGEVGSLATWNQTGFGVIDQDKQTWKLSPCEQYWFGFDPQDRPNPIDLEKPKQYTSKSVLLADELAWQIPIASYLPATWGKNYRTGEVVRRPRDEYREFCKQAKRYEEEIIGTLTKMEERLEYRVLGTDENNITWAEHLLSGERYPVDCSSNPWIVQTSAGPKEVQTEDTLIRLTECFDFCCQALALNYRLTPEIVDILGLLDDQSMISIVWAVTECDIERRLLQNAEKKSPMLTATVGELT